MTDYPGSSVIYRIRSEGDLQASRPGKVLEFKDNCLISIFWLPLSRI